MSRSVLMPLRPPRREKAISNMTEKKQRYSISVSGGTYDRMRSIVTGSLVKFVDNIVTTTLDDPVALKSVLARCHPRKEAGT